MGIMTFFIRWGCFLALALIVPVSLPARDMKGLDSRIYSRARTEPFLLTKSQKLLATPYLKAHCFRTIQRGTPLRIIRYWRSSEGNHWLQVQIGSKLAFDSNSFKNRGWIQL